MDTTACRMPTFISLNHHLRMAKAPDHLRHLIVDIAMAAKYIVREVHHGKLGSAGSTNQFMEEQIEMDVLSNEILERHMRENDLVSCYSSEEKDEIVHLHPQGPYSVVFDPLDGSSLVDVNLAIGTIVGIYEGSQLIGRKGKDQAAALYVVYGPRTILVYTLGRGKGVHEFFLNDTGEFVLHRENLRIADDAKNFAPGNIHAIAEVPAFREIFDGWIREKKKLRYSGGMVPDVHHIVSKGNGIFSFIGGAKFPQGKLRLPYECAPFAFIIEEAGGLSSNGTMSILDVPIESIDQRTPVILGSRNDVRAFESILRNI